MSSLRKWNYQKHEDEPYEVPDAWHCTAYEPDMQTLINCAQCGQEIPFGLGYTSREIHTVTGFGYSVCRECNEKEFARELQAKKKVHP